MERRRVLVLTEHRNRLVEFTDGYLEVLPMPTDKHQSVLKFLFLAFYSFAEPAVVGCNSLRCGSRFGPVSSANLIFYSLLSATGAGRTVSGWVQTWRLEVVSEEKPERDLVEKRGDYAEGRIPEYWIVNPLTETITILQLTR